MHDDGNRIRIGERVTIYQRGKKKLWIADFWQNNVHKRVTLKTANKKVAIERATKLAADLNQGTYQSAPQAITVTLAAENYVSALKTDGRSKKTTVKYAGVFKIFAEFLSKHHIANVNQVTPILFDKYRAERRAIRHEKTVYSESVIIKQLFKWCRTRKLLLDDPLVGIKLFKPYAEAKPGPSLEQVNLILAVTQGVYRFWFYVLAFTGMRVGELRRLRPVDVDLKNKWINIQSRPGAETKTRTSRKVPIHPRLHAILASLKRHNKPWFFTALPSKQYPDGDHCINPKTVNDILAGVLAKLELKAGRDGGFVAHSFRHFFETHTVNAGIPQRVIDAWLGHSADKSMAAVYYKLADEDSQAFMAKVPFGEPGDEIRVAKGA